MSVSWIANGVGQRTLQRTSALIFGSSFFLLSYLLFFWDSVPIPEQWKQFGHACPTSPPLTTKTHSPSASARRREQCVDPYRRPGYLFLDKANGDYNQTRWIPYTSAFLDAPDPVSAKYPYNSTIGGEIWYDEHSRPEDDILESALTPTQWMYVAVEESRKRIAGGAPDEQMSWLNGRVVLVVSDSVDRYNTEWFCHEFRDRAKDTEARFEEGEKSHSTAHCVVPSLNLTIVHWHFAGMTTYMPNWWWDEKSVRNVPFEERYDAVWSLTLPKLRSINGKGRPDLIIWQSTVWDRKNWLGAAKEHYGANHSMASMTRQLVWDEVRFYAARTKRLMEFLKQKLGKDVPMMLRTVTIDRSETAKDIQTLDMDRINRVVGERYDVEPFEWGKLIAGQYGLYMDSLHPAHGGASWLWSTMVLEYLARAVGAGTKGGARREREPYFDGWNKCHAYLV